MILTLLQVEDRQSFASSSGIFLRRKLNSLCNTDSLFWEEHIPRSPSASPSHCLGNTGNVYSGSRWLAYCSPCSAQTAWMWIRIHGNPKSQHNEVFLKWKQSGGKMLYFVLWLASVSITATVNLMWVLLTYTFTEYESGIHRQAINVYLTSLDPVPTSL